MAVDTAQKRFSMMGLGETIAPDVFVPSGTVTDQDTYQVMGLYSGITPDNPSPVTFNAAFAVGANTLISGGM